MTDEKMAELLRLALLSKYDDDINDEIVDQILSTTENVSSDIVVRIKKRFIEKRVGLKIAHPVKTVKPECTFGDYVETTRTFLEMTAQDLATVLEEKPDTIEGLEKGRLWPWSCSTHFIGALMRLFKLHFNAAEILITKSAAVSQAKGPIYASARSSQGIMTESRGNSTARALERFLAAKTKPEKASEDITLWLGKLKGTLASEGWTDLVDS